MRKHALAVLLALSVVAAPMAQNRPPQKTPIVSESMTIAASAVGFAAATVNRLNLAVQAAAAYDVVCIGTLETAAVRYTTEGTTPTSTVGHPWAVDQQLRVDGLASVRGFLAIRTTGTSGAVFWTCYI